MTSPRHTQAKPALRRPLRPLRQEAPRQSIALPAMRLDPPPFHSPVPRDKTHRHPPERCPKMGARGRKSLQSGAVATDVDGNPSCRHGAPKRNSLRHSKASIATKLRKPEGFGERPELNEDGLAMSAEVGPDPGPPEFARASVSGRALTHGAQPSLDYVGRCGRSGTTRLGEQRGTIAAAQMEAAAEGDAEPRQLRLHLLVSDAAPHRSRRRRGRWGPPPQAV